MTFPLWTACGFTHAQKAALIRCYRDPCPAKLRYQPLTPCKEHAAERRLTPSVRLSYVRARLWIRQDKDNRTSQLLTEQRDHHGTRRGGDVKRYSGWEATEQCVEAVPCTGIHCIHSGGMEVSLMRIWILKANQEYCFLIKYEQLLLPLTFSLPLGFLLSLASHPTSF